MLKKVFLILITITMLLLIFSSNKDKTIYTFSNNDFYELISKYNSFNSNKINEYYNLYLTNNNIIYSLNQINFPSFLNSNEKYSSFTFDDMIFVNKSCVLDKSYVPSSLVPVIINKINRPKENMLVDEMTLKYAKKMFDDAKELGLDLTVFSAYRSYQKQFTIYSTSNDLEYIAYPGTSEHQTGCALDISTKNTGLSIHFENTKEFLFLKDNAYKYGFILRYPKDKIAITGYPYECWHFRFVGIDIASFIFENNLTLEEYIYMYVELNLHKKTS